MSLPPHHTHTDICSQNSPTSTPLYNLPFCHPNIQTRTQIHNHSGLRLVRILHTLGDDDSNGHEPHVSHVLVPRVVATSSSFC
jgi:hypothetical protein